jgi:hypothetical protein
MGEGQTGKVEWVGGQKGTDVEQVVGRKYRPPNSHDERFKLSQGAMP